MLLVCTLVVVLRKNDYVFLKSSTNIQEYLDESNQSYSVYDYKVYSFPLIKVVKLYKGVQDNLVASIPKFNGDDSERLNQCIDYVSKIPYDYNQSNPNEIESGGGNCQALSIYFKNVCDVNQIPCELNGTATHEFCVVTVDNVKYQVDLANKYLKEAE